VEVATRNNTDDTGTEPTPAEEATSGKSGRPPPIARIYKQPLQLWTNRRSCSVAPETEQGYWQKT
jgi:hypothetical protein